MRKEIRRCLDNLVSIGTGVALFGIWTVIRIIMTIILERDMLISQIKNTVELSTGQIMIILGIIIVFFSLVILSIHLYIGLSARKEGLGGKKRTGYLIANGLYIIVYCIGITAEIINFTWAFRTITEGIATIFIDIAMLVTLGELMFNAVRVRKLTGQLTETEAR